MNTVLGRTTAGARPGVPSAGRVLSADGEVISLIIVVVKLISVEDM